MSAWGSIGLGQIDLNRIGLGSDRSGIGSVCGRIDLESDWLGVGSDWSRVDLGSGRL